MMTMMLRYYELASFRIRAMLLHRLMSMSEMEISQKLRYEPNRTVMDGILFESLVHMRFVRGGSFPVRNLETQTTTHFEFTAPELCTFRDDTELQTLGSQKMERGTARYLRPLQRNHASLDSILLRDTDVFGMQITVSKEHPVKLYRVEEVKNSLRCENFSLCFVVPEDNYALFREQRYTARRGLKAPAGPTETIKQYVLSIEWS